MVAVPFRQVRKRLTTDRTATVLLLPEGQQHPSTFEVACHGHAETLFKVDFPGGVKRICRPFDLRVSFDRHTRSGEQFDTGGPTCCVLPVPTEHPVAVA